MNRLAWQITLTIVAVTLLTITLMTGLQFYGVGREQRSLPPEFRGPLRSGDVIGRVLVAPRPSVILERERRGAARASLPLESALVTTIEVQEALSPRQVGGLIQALQFSRLRSLLISGALAVLLAVGLGLLLSRYIARPIRRVSLAAEQLAQGNLRVRVPLAPRLQGGDETTQLARNFNAMADSLERLEHERKAMIADIAHELRTPLTVMRGRLEALEDGLAPLELAEVRDLHGQTLLLSRLVEDLRLLSLAEAGRLSIDRRPADLAELAGRALQQFEAVARGKGAALQLDAPEAVLAEVDEDRLLQVLVNLLDNALRHVPPGGIVRVGVAPTARSVVLTVADTGPGLPEMLRERVFDRFVRAEEGRDRHTGGSGLGLAIVKALVELHGGRVSAANAAAGGAEFRVVLPLGSSAAVAVGPLTPRQASTAG